MHLVEVAAGALGLHCRNNNEWPVSQARVYQGSNHPYVVCVVIATIISVMASGLEESSTFDVMKMLVIDVKSMHMQPPSFCTPFRCDLFLLCC